jgi:hypothetical protein
MESGHLLCKPCYKETLDLAADVWRTGTCVKCREVSKASLLDEVLCKPDGLFAYKDENKHLGDEEEFKKEAKARCRDEEKYIGRWNSATGMSISTP